MAQSRILVFWYVTTYLLLEKNKPKYQPLEAPPPVNQTKPQLEVDQSKPQLEVDETEPQSELDETEPQLEDRQPVESDDSPGQSFEILETPTVDQGKLDSQQLESPRATAPLSLFDLDGF